MAPPDDHLNEKQIRFQEAFGARVFTQGKPRVLLEVKSPDIPTVMYGARLRGYDQAKESAPRTRRRTKAKDPGA